jgi:hypothetical protein
MHGPCIFHVLASEVISLTRGATAREPSPSHFGSNAGDRRVQQLPGSGRHFSGSVNGGSVQLYDCGESGHFNYTV